MKLPWKMKTATTLTCPCHDPLVFGHEKPCERWETQHNNNPHRPPLADGHPYLMTEFQVGSIAMATIETALAMRRLRRTVEQFNQLIAEVDLVCDGDGYTDGGRATHPHEQQPDGPA
jgi:hypothetical protein